ncbi:helix-turn-helix transcriptional regulator [Actinacidiphila soli]|uniref:helix-turn-helix transcriptional regulator n=1 Tax=Actinacidiphila soli TaxID=2487275 RepID=UPI002AFE2474|nr:helix-turn-helix transcriptional regulator [Actinacidiphila soli]
MSARRPRRADPHRRPGPRTVCAGTAARGVPRRSRIQPATVGLISAGERRRVPVLRREEVATRAGLSEPYYRGLEQGVAVNASPQVLDALARSRPRSTST